MNEIEIYEKAFKKWGKDPQLIMTFEELGELTNTLAKVIRGRGSLFDLADEIADVRIMLNQLVTIYDLKETVLARHRFKIKRLEERLNE